MEVSKADKKVARIIIEKGLMKEFDKGLNKADKILNDWKQGKEDSRTAYLALYKHLEHFDKELGRNYDNVPNNYILLNVVRLFNEGLIDAQEFNAFSDEGKMIIRRILSLNE